MATQPFVCLNASEPIFEKVELNPPATLADFKEAGQSIRSWALARGFNPGLVYVVLKGERKCLRGESFRIAKELGMK